MGSSLAARRAKAGAGSHTAITATESLSRMNERPRDVPLKDITLDWRLQFRMDVKKSGLDEKHLTDLMHVIADGQDTEPVILYRVDGDLLMADGFHRIEAYRRSERTTIPAIVRDGSYEDAEECAENANLQYRKRLSDESKKYIFARRVQRGYLTNGISWLNLSDKAIAAQLGVSYQAVNDWFEELQSGVKFLTPDSQEVSIQVSVDRSVVYGRDGKRYEVEAIREANTKRAAELAERRVAEEAERKRNLPAVEKIRIVTQYLLAKYRDDYAKKKNPLMDDPKRGFEWCYQVSNPASFVVDIDWERQFLHEYGAKPIHVYREFLRLADREVFTRADMDGWTDIQLEDWVREMGRRPPRQPNTTTFQQTGMAQPKHPDAPYQPSPATGRHRLTDPPAAPETDEPELDTIPAPCPFKKGDKVVYHNGRPYAVLGVKWDGQTWQLHVLNEHGLDFYDSASQFVPACTFKTGDLLVFKPTGEHWQVVGGQWNGQGWTLEVTNQEGQQLSEDASYFELSTAVVAEEQAVAPFHTGDIVRDLQSGELVEVIGSNSDGSLRVEGDDEEDEPHQYEGRVEDFAKYDTHADPPSKAATSNGKRQAEIMVEDARSIMPRLLVNTADACVDFRMTTLVRWESFKSIQTILANGDANEIHLIERDLRRAQGEVSIVATLVNTILNNLDAMLAEIEGWAQRA
ncbi:MAG: ParB/RepB/Spo0J family partition protein [Anaerolineae bacterium]|nr:ParB/RepB/Spo0J family partition protein [Anaerolineae bacterium]